MKPMIIALFDRNSLLLPIATQLDIEIGKIILRDFPDNETYIKFENSTAEREIIFIDSLNQPNGKILPLLFAAETAKHIGAKSVGLCAPYLAYMRQDKEFSSGEATTAGYFATLLSQYFDWLVTVDPHLHRYHDLNEIYSVPNTIVHAASKIAEWVVKNVRNPILIGPDSESEQWVKQIAKEANAPYLVLKKIRHGDRDVEISLPEVQSFLTHTPVLIDDIISTGRTLVEVIKHLKQVTMKPPICIGIHAVFSGNAYETLLEAGARKVVTCNTINHPSNQIDLSVMLSKGIQQQLRGH